MRFDQYAGHCIVSNFWHPRNSLLQIPTAAETPSVLTLARSTLIRLPTLDCPSWLIVPAASALACHLLADHQFSLHITDRHWWNPCRSVTFGLHSPLTPMTLVTSKTRLLCTLPLLTLPIGSRRIASTSLRTSFHGPSARWTTILAPLHRDQDSDITVQQPHLTNTTWSFDERWLTRRTPRAC